MNIEKPISFKTKDEYLKKVSEPINHFVFVLLNNFSFLDFSSAIEILRLANKIEEKKIVSWKLLSVHTTRVCSSNGIYIHTDGLLEELKRKNNLVICGGTDIKNECSKELLSWIRKHYRKGVNIVGLSTATQIMAMAGILKDKKCTIHWENKEAFSEDFPDHQLSSSIYTIDENCFTSAGGTASIDLFLYFLAKNFNNEISNLVADQINHTYPRTDKDEQKLSTPRRVGVKHPKLQIALEIMESSLENPISPSKLAEKIGISTRQLERLFRKYLNLSPKKYCLHLRLSKARILLLKTNMSIINVALTSGFSSPSHFSKCYRNHFNVTPYKEREQKCFNKII